MEGFYETTLRLCQILTLRDLLRQEIIDAVFDHKIIRLTEIAFLQDLAGPIPFKNIRLDLSADRMNQSQKASGLPLVEAQLLARHDRRGRSTDGHVIDSGIAAIRDQ